MGLVRGAHCVLWGGLAALLCSGLANSDRDVEAALARLDVAATHAHSDAALASLGLGAARPDPDASVALADPVEKVALANPDVTEPEVTASPLEASDECVGSDDCVDQYLWLVYERARKIDTIKVTDRIKVTVKKKGKSRTVTKTVTKLVDEDFTWKDPQAAQKTGMSMMNMSSEAWTAASRGGCIVSFARWTTPGLRLA